MPASAGLVPRHLAPHVQESLQDTPAVLINGPRQCGKTTLALQFCSEALPYFCLDDPGLLAAVRADPTGFARRLDCAIIDEVQRAPELLMALKLAIDKDRRPGRFLLTGSANLMALPQIADSLAGRMAIHSLLPLSNAEIARRPNDFLERACAQNWPLTVRGAPAPDLLERVLTGGYPEMQARADKARRAAWARNYLTTLVERDIREVAQLDQIHQIPRLLAIAAELSGQITNMSQIGGQIGLNGKTVDKYIGILEKIFLVRRLPAWTRNNLSRMVKTPKLHFVDAGLQASLTRLSAEEVFVDRSRLGATLETWVHGELLKAMSLAAEPWFLCYYRDKDQVEVDFVLESPTREVIGIEVKAAASVAASDFKGLRKLRELTGRKFLTGIVLYDGTQALPFGEGLWAVPLDRL